MAERTIVGVDFSGAQGDNATWITKAVLQGETLEIKDCDRIKRRILTEYLESLMDDADAIVAMDFPFSVPQKFAEVLVHNPSTMPDVWNAVANIKEYRQFDELRRKFVKHHGEMTRKGDAHFGGPFSPLKSVNPDMLPMTFHGMKMLNHLWGKGFRVPPLRSDSHRNGPTLLETMPGVLLRCFGLPARNYKTKNKTNQGHPENNREIILVGLEQKFGQFLHINPRDRERKKCWNNADCLDSFVAAIGAALWAMNQSHFLIPRESIPQSEELDYAQLEGWIYAPKK